MHARLEAYACDLERRAAVKRGEVMSSLRRNLAPLLSRELADLTRSDVLARRDALEADGRPGAAENYRTSVSAFLGWAAAEGHIGRTPLEG